MAMGCMTSSVRFESALISGPRLPTFAIAHDLDGTDEPSPLVARNVVRNESHHDSHHETRVVVEHPTTVPRAESPRTPAPLTAITATESFDPMPAERTGIVWSRLPAPHRDGFVVPAPELIHSVEAIRGLIGARTTAHSLAWATTIQAQLVDHPNDTHDSQRIAAIVADDGPAFVALAEHSDRFVGWSQSSRTPTPRVGDLLAFDFVDNNRPASLFAVVLSIDDRGVVEMAYAGAGVVRRGFVDVNHPSARRDHDGRVCNTYMRHGKDWPPAGTHYLAGELVRGAIR